MKEDKFNTNDPTLSVDLSEATQAVKENRFEDGLALFKIILFYYFIKRWQFTY